MVITSRARLLVVCAMLSLPPVDGAPAADPQIKPRIRGLVSMAAYRFVGKGGDRWAISGTARRVMFLRVVS